MACLGERDAVRLEEVVADGAEEREPDEEGEVPPRNPESAAGKGQQAEEHGGDREARKQKRQHGNDRQEFLRGGRGTTMPAPQRIRAYAALVSSMVIWGFSFLATKELLREIILAGADSIDLTDHEALPAKRTGESFSKPRFHSRCSSGLGILC